MFVVDSQLKQDTISLAALSLCDLLLMNDANYPWLILVPRRPAIRELLELSDLDQRQYLRESNAIGKILQIQFKAEKLNIAALGNVVSQLHVHHVARFHNDPVWPKPVWGAVPPLPYQAGPLAEVIELIFIGLNMETKVSFQWKR